MLPELYEPFELVQIRVLPFSLTDNGQTVRFKLESELAAMNSVGESFLFPVGICRREQDLRICDIRGIKLHRQALTCAESLLTDSDEIPDMCKKSAVIVTPIRQEYVYHELENTSKQSVGIFTCEGKFHATLWGYDIATRFRKGSEQCTVARRV